MKTAGKKIAKILLWVGIVVLIGLAGAFAVLNGGTAAETVAVQTGNIVQTVADTGYVQAATDYDLQAVQNGRVARVAVTTGQRVQAGQALVVLENLDLSAQIVDTRSQLSQTAADIQAGEAAERQIDLDLQKAQDNLERLQTLYEAQAIPQADYEEAKIGVQSLEQSLQQQTAQLESTQAKQAGLNQTLQNLNHKEKQLTIQSPVNGVVLDLPAKQEQVVSQGTLLVTISVPDKLEIKADILSDDMSEVKAGQQVQITAPVLGSKVLYGKVKEIYPLAVEQQSALGVIQRRVPVIISLSDPANLKPGYEVNVAIETSTAKGVPLIPREALHTLPNGDKEVMVVQNNLVLHKPVHTGIGDRDNIAITSGLAAGEIIIRDGSQALKDHTRIKPPKQ